MSRLCVSLSLILFSVCALAQYRRQLADLSVRVRYADEQTAEAGLRVELLTPTGTPMDQAGTDSRGQVDFQVPVGNYKLRISGVNVETLTTQEFGVNFGEFSHTEFVEVQRRKTAMDTASGGKSPSATIPAEALKLPKKARAAYEKGNEKLARQDWKEARKQFEKAIHEAPGFAAAQHDLGVTCDHLADEVCARQAFETAIRLDPKMAPAYLNLARLEFKARNFLAAETLLKKYVAAAPQDGRGLVLLSEAELENGDFAAALADAQRVNASPQHATFGIAHYVAARALEAQQRAPEAAQEYEIFLRENPAAPQAAVAREALERLKPPNR